jgi:pilus assembly protein TadC
MDSIPFIEEFGKAFLPKKYRTSAHTYLEKAGVYYSPFLYIGSSFYISLAITAILMFLLVYPQIISWAQSWGVAGLGGSLIVGGMVFVSWAGIQFILMVLLLLSGYFFLDIRIYKRTRQIEFMLPEFLTIVSTNLKGGMGLEGAMWNSMRPKFGTLTHEITLISKKVMTGHDVAEALKEFAEKYDSPELKRTFSLIVSELEIGGKISNIIDDIIHHLKNTQKLKREMQASVISYIIFISAIVVVIAPILFALSYNLVNFMQGFIEKVGGALSQGNVPGFLSSVSPGALDPEAFKIFGYFTTGTIAFISSIIVAIIEKGDVRAGLKYLPIFLTLSLLVYYLALTGLGFVLGGITI